MAGRIDPFNTFGFSLSMGDIEDERFREVSGLSVEQPTIEATFCTAQGELVVLKAPGAPKYQDITFKRPLTHGVNSLAGWYHEVRMRQVPQGFTGSIVLRQTDTYLASWTFSGAWPVKYTISPLNSATNEAVIEELTITVESLVPDYAAL